MLNIKALTLAIFLSNTNALQLEGGHHHHFRPPSQESAPWHKTPAKEPKIEFPNGYFVPDFGMDQDVIHTGKHIADQEAKHGAWNPSKDENGKWNVPTAHNNDSYSYRNNLGTLAQSSQVHGQHQKHHHHNKHHSKGHSKSQA